MCSYQIVWHSGYTEDNTIMRKGSRNSFSAKSLTLTCSQISRGLTQGVFRMIFQVLCSERILCSNVAQAFTEINNALTVVACNSFYVGYIKENINTAAFPCKLFKEVSTCGGREES